MSLDITLSFPGGKRVDAWIGQWTITTDQEADSGGEESSPNPFQYFLSSLATCSGVYLLNFCQARDIPMDNISMRMRTEWNEKTHHADRIVFELKLPPEFPAKYKDAVVRTINMCTVKKHLLDPPEFDVEVEME